MHVTVSPLASALCSSQIANRYRKSIAICCWQWNVSTVQLCTSACTSAMAHSMKKLNTPYQMFDHA